jgi:FixJ family two-component response regulator
MSNTSSPNAHGGRFAVLFVDDEEMAQKYFRKACESDFEVLTASSVDAAIGLLQGQSDHIGVLVTDQRMPEKTGTDLLQLAHVRYPQIVRILTTAYSDLDSAIEAVNSGAIFQYVSKPWNVRVLRGILLRAMDHFRLQRERDALLTEKLSVLQRMLMLDRARTLCVLGAALADRLHNPLHAINDYLDFIFRLAPTVPPPASAGWEDLWMSNVGECESALAVTRTVSAATAASTFTDLPAALVTAAMPPTCLQTPFAAPDRITADERLMKQLGVCLASVAAALWPQDGFVASCRRAGADCSLVLTGRAGAPAADAGVQALLQVARHVQLTPAGPWLDLLLCHLIVAHHGGRIAITIPGPNQALSITLQWPTAPTQRQLPALAPTWIEDRLGSFES